MEYTPDELKRAAERGYRELSDLSGRSALVIGVGDLGAVGALGLAVAGADVAVANRDRARATQVAREVDAMGKRSAVIEVDVTDAGSVRRAVDSAIKELGKIDIVLCGFGTNSRQPAEDLTEAQWDQVVDTNLKGTFLCCQAAYRALKESGHGRIIVIGSAAGSVARAWPPTSAYGASKAGAAHLVRFLAAEWALSGVTVNAIAPGYFRTRLTQPLSSDPDRLKSVLALTPMARLGELHEFVGAVVYLASDAAAFVTGHSLAVDGGRAVV